MKKLFLLLLLGLFLINFASAVPIIQTQTADSGYSTNSQTAKYGSTFRTNSSSVADYYMIYNVTKASISTATRAYIQSADGGISYGNATFTGNTATFSSPIQLNASTYYEVVLDADGGSYNRAYKASFSPVPLLYINYTGNEGNASEMGQIINMYVDVMNGTRITINSPQNSSTYLTQTTINFSTSSVSTVELSNITMYINGQLNETKSISGTSNNTNFTKTFNTQGNYSYYFTSCASDNSCINSTNQTLFIVNIIINSVSYNSSTFETGSESFIVNLSSSSSLTAVSLVYNSTSYPMTNLSDGRWSKTIDVPTGVGYNSFYFNYTYGGTYSQSSTYNQQANLTVLAICNATYTTQFFNLTFKDESSLATINATISLGTFNYYLGSGTVEKTYTLTNNTPNLNYTFCTSAPLRPINLEPEVQYASNSYPQRIWSPGVQSYTNTSTNQVLYLLSSSVGLYVTFQVVSSADQPLTGVLVNATRLISGTTTLVASGTTGSDGSVTFFLNPDFQHTLQFLKSGYELFTYTTYPTQTSYTITLGGTTSTSTNYVRGISYELSPSTTFLDQDSLQNFSFGLLSSYYSLDSFGFNISYGNGTLIGSNSSTSVSGGTLYLFNINVSNGTYLYIQPYYIINGTTTLINTPRAWRLQPIEGRQYSIWNLFQNIDTSIDTGLFGFNDFGRILIVVLLLVIMVGTLSQRYGLASESGVTGLIFGVVFLFEVGLDFLPEIQIPLTGVTLPQGFLTAIVFFLLLATILREESR
jgi:hypothetical protein